KQAKSAFHRGMWLSITIVVLSILIGIAASWFLAHSLTVDLASVARAAGSLAGGDFTKRTGVNRTDEVGVVATTFDAMAALLEARNKSDRETRAALEGGVERLRSASADILASVTQFTSSASEQSAAVSETSATVDGLRAASEQTARKA